MKEKYYALVLIFFTSLLALIISINLAGAVSLSCISQVIIKNWNDGDTFASPTLPAYSRREK
jgi:hypothetical protein